MLILMSVLEEDRNKGYGATAPIIVSLWYLRVSLPFKVSNKVYYKFVVKRLQRHCQTKLG